MLITDQVATAPCTDPIQVRRPTLDALCTSQFSFDTPTESSPKRLPRRINRRDQRRYTIRWDSFDFLIAITILRLNRAPIFYEHHAKDVRRHALHRIV